MYVLTHNDRVLLGPINFNSRMFNSEIEDELEIVTNIRPSDVNNVPLDLGDGLKIRFATETRDIINSKIQVHTGPFWEFTETTGNAHYVAADKSIDIVKQELKEVLAAERYRREISGAKTTIQGLEVTVETARGIRDVFVQQFLLLPEDGTTTWKFQEGWLTLTKSELGQCVQAGVSKVQSAFDWEASVVILIDSATTLTGLDAIEIVPTPVSNLGVL